MGRCETRRTGQAWLKKLHLGVDRSGHISLTADAAYDTIAFYASPPRVVRGGVQGWGIVAGQNLFMHQRPEPVTPDELEQAKRNGYPGRDVQRRWRPVR